MRTIILTVFTLFLSITSMAKDFTGDTIHQKLFDDFLILYQQNNEKAFYKAAVALGNYYKDNDDLGGYFKTQLNICLYDIEQQHAERAMKRANQMNLEMQTEGYDGYSLVYTALGNIYESRGNYRIAKHYYEESLNCMHPDDKTAKIDIESRLAVLLIFVDPVSAKRWNDKYHDESMDYAPYRQVNLFAEALIQFAVGNYHDFRLVYSEYQEFRSKHIAPDEFGRDLIEAANLSINGKSDSALVILSTPAIQKRYGLTANDMRICIFKRIGRYEEATRELEKRSNIVDSLSSDLIYNSLNEANAAAGLSRAAMKVSQTRERMFIYISIAAILLAALLGGWIFHFRRTRKVLDQRNAQLKTALAMAEEGEKMKTEFVRSVSHEIRTPLNAIAGFNDILNSPGMDLYDEEREDLVRRIKENVNAITDIVDEMLRVADKESNEFDTKSDKIYLNQMLQGIVNDYRTQVSPTVDLKYTTRVINRFQITTNAKGLQQIMEQLMQNAIKFTVKGSIIVHTALDQEGKNVLISVTDTGTGIDPTKRDHIFDGFYKADAFQQGIGLGLTVSKKVAKKLGGDLTIDDNYTEGARFILSLPVEG